MSFPPFFQKFFSPFTKWFAWLQQDNPVGDVVLYPELNTDGETSVKGVYIVGDLTGLPLLKFATTKAKTLVEKFGPSSSWGEVSASFLSFSDNKDTSFSNKIKAQYDLVIIGAGPAGAAAAIEAKRLGLTYVVLEASDRPFDTLQNFPKGKPMFYEPDDLVELSPLTMEGKTKEELLTHLCGIFDQHDLHVEYTQKVDAIYTLSGRGENIIVTNTHAYAARKTILAIGKSGNARRLEVPGEDLAHVYNKLYDPAEFKGNNILVVGGGDTALESAILLAKAGNKVTISYRKHSFTRPKPGNINMVNTLVKSGQITLLMNSLVREIRERDVTLHVGEEAQTQAFHAVFSMIGTQLPYEFFKKSGIKIANAKTRITWWWLAFSIAFMNIVYFGKSSYGLETDNGFIQALGSIFSGDWVSVSTKLIAWLSVLTLFITGAVVLRDLISKWSYYFQTKWAYIKHGYFFFVVVFYFFIFLGSKYFHVDLGGQDPFFWYGLLYTVTIGLFGIRRITVSKKRYVTIQTLTIFLIQALPLFFIPNYVLPWFNDLGLITPWITEHVFLGGEWWRFVGFILAWPLFFWNVFTSEPSVFWLIVSLIQTFVIIPFIVIKWGKGAYCSWICSCGAMAETLGDEYRTLAPHGERAKKWDNAGQIVLLAIFITTILHMLGWIPSLSEALRGVNELLLGGYKVIVDTLLAGTIGIGLYFFFSGRVWCRFYCPLAALMHIYNKFSTWGILADKKKCISCGLCTKSCHMGIDVMGFAQQGKTVNDVECVNCSACVNVCPTGVLSFGKYKRLWGKK
ncbi:MAG: NAD(P)-binding domain-containing protein [Candidatus Magasanikbacteria bacterium]|jgi:NosR/NirI family transcriptional regulator, nitrous oxide reductase regulator|nr:NAD(P)-binding domain-containing protein [Candidatus Magasanikbacteria bacterium]MBT6252834.1 NAD(P)-binding domain-containing protein [Candidatus Magasanikbacteria bacterium]MBT6334400.1 NAD(P)-binding domain-containing protein [Candidatus Magasanikbacteria bacterium]MBT7755316.1 NAD(P)-binding domain-containing protein [Candidatus Magasanikbacteria bacterium]